MNYLDFKDGSHLNAKGATKISKHLGEFIKESYQIPNRANDEQWLLVHESFESVMIKEFEKNKITVNKQLLPHVTIKAINTFSNNQKRYLAIELNDNIKDSLINNFSIGIHIFPSDVEHLSDRAKSMNRKFDILTLKMDVEELSNRKFIVQEVLNPIKGDSKSNIFLYDKEKYQGIVGRLIVIENVSYMEN